MLETKRLILRNFELSDLDDLYEFTSNKKVCEMSGWIYLEDKHSVETILKSLVKKKFLFAIVLKSENKVIGLIEIMDVDLKANKNIEIISGAKEIAFLLNEEYWHKGYGLEAVNKVLEYAFLNLNIPQVFAGHKEFNISSKNLQNKLNFKTLGQIKLHSVVYNKDYIHVQRCLYKEDYIKFLKK